MSAKRKLFLTHAGELANRLVHAVQRDGLVAQFVRSYSERYSRRKLLSDTPRLRELEVTIGREALLLIAVEIRRILPKAFASGPRGTLRPEEAILCDAFYAEFLASLERALEWHPAETTVEAASFQRDLEMYRRWSNRSAAPSALNESPFPDRCAILLDPAMMEQARRAAFEFETELALTGGRMLSRLGSQGARPPAKRRAPEPRRPKPKHAQPTERKPRRAKKSATRRRTPHSRSRR